MKKTILLFLCISFLSSCKLFSFLKGKEKSGCPTNGKNVGAEKILSGDAASLKAVKKAKKFKYQ